jgi:hypothetical protein
MRRWLGRVKERIAGPNVIDIVDPQVRVFKKVRRLRIDFERVFLVEEVQIEALAAHLSIVLQTTTNGSEAGAVIESVQGRWG